MEGHSGRSMDLRDRISGIPDEVKELILGYLPISDAVRTSVLSKKWRSCWTRVAQLNLQFDEKIEKGQNRDRYCRLVGRIFLSHVGSIRKCVMRPLWDDLDEGCKGWDYLEGDMNLWLLWLSRKGIEDLTIGLRKGDRDVDNIRFFMLPPSLFQCLELSCLTLENCVIPESAPFTSFPNLVKVHLFESTVHGDILEKLVSCCPLEMLCVDNCYLGFEEISVSISSPNLKIFKFVLGRYEDFCWNLKFTPNLKVATFVVDTEYVDERLSDPNYFNILGCIPKIEEFTLDCRLHKTSASDVIPTKLPRLLLSLKSMTLNHMDVLSKDDMSFMFCITRSSPNLQDLTIHLARKFHSTFTKESLENVTTILEAEDIGELKTSITTLSITFVSVDVPKRVEGYIGLIDALVSCCPNLEKLFIKSPLSLEASAEKKLSNAVPKFGDSSSKPKIIIIHSKVI